MVRPSPPDRLPHADAHAHARTHMHAHTSTCMHAYTHAPWDLPMRRPSTTTTSEHMCMHARTRKRAHAHEPFPHRSCCAAAASAAVWCVCSELATFVRPLSPCRFPFGSAGDAVGFRVRRQCRSHGWIMLCPHVSCPHIVRRNAYQCEWVPRALQLLP
jgi:hypothetical protein